MSTRALLLTALLLVAAIHSTQAVILFQEDDFEDLTLENWEVGPLGFAPANILNGGPLGAGDNYLEVTSLGGGGANSRMIILNTNQWTGNYNAAGVSVIELDLKNFGSAPLTIRLSFKTEFGNTPGYTSTVGFSLPNNGLWHHAIFPLQASSFTAVGSPSVSFSQLLSNNGELRILHSAFPSTLGDAINSKLGVDNVRAVPEPGSALLLILGLGVVGVRRRSRRIW